MDTLIAAGWSHQPAVLMVYHSWFITGCDEALFIAAKNQTLLKTGCDGGFRTGCDEVIVVVRPGRKG
jgi:hypothetical protein